MLLFQLPVLGGQLRLLNGEKQHADGDEHDGGHHQEQGLIVHMGQALHLGVGVHDGGHGQVEYAAHGAHQVDDGVALAAQGLGGHIRHESHSGRAVGAHGDEQQAQHDDEGHQLEGGGGGGIAVIQQGQEVQQNDGAAGAEEDEGHPLAQLGIRPVRNAAEDRQQKQGQYIIRRHDGAG